MSSQYSDQYRKLFECIKEDVFEDEQDFRYRVDDRGVIIEKYLGNKTDLIIPTSFESLPVYKIDDEAFCEEEQLQKVTLPNTIRVVGNRAFAESSLETIVLPNSLLIIGEQAFADSNLKSANIPESVSVIGEYAFSGTEIDSITIPRLIMSIGAGAFEGTRIKTIRIPNSVKVVSEEMFCACPELHTVIIEGAEKIEEAAFQYCKKLKNIYLPDTLLEIERCSFEDTGIEFLIIPQSVLSIGEDNFPKNSKIAVLSDSTVIDLNYYRDVYSTVTLYCNQSNTAVREVAKEYGFKRKLLSAFAKESIDYYKYNCEYNETELMDRMGTRKSFCEPTYCQKSCEFFDRCHANKEICIKEIIDEMISQLSTREERLIRLMFGIEELKEDSKNLILQALNLITLQDSDQYAFCLADDSSLLNTKIEHLINIKKKALRKLRHPKQSRALRSIDVGLVLLSSNEANYYNLWCAIFGVHTESRQVELEWYLEKKQAEEAQRRKAEEELANTSAEQLPEIRKKILARSTLIEDLDLSMRALHCLKHAGINTVEDLINMTWDEFIRIRNLGKKSGDEVLLKLEQLGFSLKSFEE